MAASEQIYVSFFDGPGLFRSSDYGQNWQQIPLESPYTYISAMSFKPGIIIAGFAYTPGPTQKAFFSTTGGNSWTASDWIAVDEFQIVRLFPSTHGIDFAAAYGFGSFMRRSSDDGHQWENLNMTGVLHGEEIIDIVERPAGDLYISFNMEPLNHH